MEGVGPPPVSLSPCLGSAHFLALRFAQWLGWGHSVQVAVAVCSVLAHLLSEAAPCPGRHMAGVWVALPRCSAPACSFMALLLARWPQCPASTAGQLEPRFYESLVARACGLLMAQIA